MCTKVNGLLKTNVKAQIKLTIFYHTLVIKPIYDLVYCKCYKNHFVVFEYGLIPDVWKQEKKSLIYNSMVFD